jgi:hypothetical protein
LLPRLVTTTFCFSRHFSSRMSSIGSVTAMVWPRPTRKSLRVFLFSNVLRAISPHFTTPQISRDNSRDLVTNIFVNDVS